MPISIVSKTVASSSSPGGGSAGALVLTFVGGGTFVQGVAFNAKLLATGGTAPYTYSLQSGTLPTGLTMTAGVISGTPSAAGTFTWVGKVVDAASASKTVNCTVVITANAPAQPFSVVIAEKGPRTLDLTNQSTHTTMEVTIQEYIAGSGGLQPGTQLHVQFSSDNGATWGYDQIVAANRTTQDATHTYWVSTVDVSGSDVWVMTTSVQWKARAWAMNTGSDGGPAGAVTSTACTVPPIGSASSTGAILSVGPLVNTVDPTSGAQSWKQTITIKTPGGADPNCWQYQVTVIGCGTSGVGYSAGTFNGAAYPAAVETLNKGLNNDGQTYTITISGSYFPSGWTYNSIDYKVYGITRTGTAANLWTDPTSVLQQWPTHNGIGGGNTDYISTFGPMPSGQIPATNILPDTLGPGILPDANGRPSTGSQNSSYLSNNSQFEFGNLSGWAADNGTFVFDASNGVNGTGCAARTGSSGVPLDVLRNTLYVPCNAGSRFSASAQVKSTSGAAGFVQVRINFYNAAKSAEVGSVAGSVVSATTTYQASTIAVLASAIPAGAVWARIEIVIQSNTFGTWYIDNAYLSTIPGSASGVTSDANGNLVINADNSTVGVNGSGQVVIPTGGVQTNNLAPGSLGDLSKYSSTVRTVAIVFSLPSLPNALYPQGAIIFNTADGKTYRNTGGCVTSIGFGTNPMGSGYINGAPVTISGGGGSGAAGYVVTNSSGGIINIYVTNPGTGYTSTPSVTISGPGSGGSAWANIATSGTQLWQCGGSAQDIFAGILGAGVGYFGTINAGQINAGTFNGCSLYLSNGQVAAQVNTLTSSAMQGVYGLSVFGSEAGWNSSGAYMTPHATYYYRAQSGYSVSPGSAGTYCAASIGSRYFQGDGLVIANDPYNPNIYAQMDSTQILIQDASYNKMQISATGIRRNGVLLLGS